MTQQTVGDVVRQMEPSPEEVEALEETAPARDGIPQQSPRKVQNGVVNAPNWAIVPAGLVLPKGRVVTFLKLEAALCSATVDKGDRQVIMWELSVRDERAARSRTMGDSTRTYDELAKQMFRSMDGALVNWGNPLAVETFWDEIGPKHRDAIVSWYLHTHRLTDAERLRFFAYSVDTKTAT